MNESQVKTPVLRRFFGGLTEQAFQARLGVADPPLTDYLTDMLVRFVRCDVIFRIRDLEGRPLVEVAEMLVEAQERLGDAQREVHRHVGDFILFWAGIYPETLKRMRGPHTQDHLLDYCSQGKRAYYIASTIKAHCDYNAPADVLERLSAQFELCVYGLGEVRRQWESHYGGDNDSQRPLLIN